MRCYLAGAMDRCPNGGVQWRDDITPFLNSKGVLVFNPAKKPCELGIEDEQMRAERRIWKSHGKWNKVRKQMKEVRHIDLRAVDESSFIIVNIDTNIFACGTIEEIDKANMQKKPVLMNCEQGKAGFPDWLFAMVPHQHLFDNWNDLKRYLTKVDMGVDRRSFNRWVFLNWEGLDKTSGTRNQTTGRSLQV